ncbi:ATP-binding protein [Thermococcus celer]|uniref:AAA family ATPase n=1 Tax=Thermococcus celer Vu 13 = JCM 8558 TaxID=1293037 RepID=A0A218P4R6_THECE|nr:ATP-binding protein [Thermococcus celer]ASI99914.1 AAA family ATPase [Thermococcus celer] [Thermococcus celer Vu 13 = JCM 8558]
MIELQNPWWFDEPDRDWELFDKLTYRLRPGWLDGLSLRPFSLNFVVGPRRVGKTLGIKLLIRELLERVKSPYGVFYFSCDVVEDYNGLLEVLNEYLKVKRRKKLGSAFIFLDEVSLVRDWWRALKFLIDRGELRNDVVTVTGSISLTLGRHFETFGGRRGSGRTVEVMPLSFHDYYGLFYDDFFPSKAEEVFENYLETGGYLAYLNGTLKVEELVGFLKADIRALDRSTDLARELMGALLDKAPSPLSFNSLAKAIGISPHTARDYVELFEALHVLLQVPYLGGDGKVYPRKERKLILRDPLIARAMGLWTGKGIDRAVLYEWLVQEHLRRKFGEVYYYRNSHEVDAIAGGIKVEVKSGERRGRYPRDVRVLAGKDVPAFLYSL